MNPNEPTPAPSHGASETPVEEDHPGWVLWCREGECFWCEDEAAVRYGVRRLMFDDVELSERDRQWGEEIADELLKSGSFSFEGDPPLNLIRADAEEQLHASREENERLRAENDKLLDAPLCADHAQGWFTARFFKHGECWFCEWEKKLAAAERERDEARAEVDSLSKRVCQSCDGYGSIGNPPDDYRSCPDCTLKWQKLIDERDALKAQLAEAEAKLEAEKRRSQSMYDAGKDAMRSARDHASEESKRLRDALGSVGLAIHNHFTAHPTAPQTFLKRAMEIAATAALADSGEAMQGDGKGEEA